jgi:hypothetical protein
LHWPCTWRIGRIGSNKRLLDFVDHGLGIHRVEPDMGIKLAVLMPMFSFGLLVMIVVMSCASASAFLS